MRYMKTENNNFIVEDKTVIKLPHKNSTITRYAFFSKDFKFIKLTEYIVWKSLTNNKRDIFELDESFFEFKFPSIHKYNFVDEVITNNGEKIRMFYRWVVKNNHIFPTLTFFCDRKNILIVKYDLFAGIILEKDKEQYIDLISENRNATFPKWCKFLMFNTLKKYLLNNKKLLDKFKKQ